MKTASLQNYCIGPFCALFKMAPLGIRFALFCPLVPFQKFNLYFCHEIVFLTLSFVNVNLQLKISIYFSQYDSFGSVLKTL